MARLSRRFQATLHASAEYVQYQTLDEFSKEIEHMQEGYQPGRLEDCRQRGIPRKPGQPSGCRASAVSSTTQSESTIANTMARSSRRASATGPR